MLNEQDRSSSEAIAIIHTILIVEDDKDISSFLVEAIHQETPHLALSAADGNQALNILHDCKPSLLLLDYGLPDMNGLELYDHVHAIQELEDIPVLLLSANCPWSEVKKRKIICLAKPVEIDELLKTIEHLLPLREFS